MLKCHEAVAEEKWYHHPTNSLNDLATKMAINPDMMTGHGINLRAEIARLKLGEQGCLAVLVIDSLVDPNHKRFAIWESNHGDCQNHGQAIKLSGGGVISHQINGTLGI